MKLYLVGQNRTKWGTGKIKSWELQGIFDSKERAVKECRNYHYWIHPMNLNESIPDETILMTDVEWPIQATWKDNFRDRPFVSILPYVREKIYGITHR